MRLANTPGAGERQQAGSRQFQERTEFLKCARTTDEQCGGQRNGVADERTVPRCARHRYCCLQQMRGFISRKCQRLGKQPQRINARDMPGAAFQIPDAARADARAFSKLLLRESGSEAMLPQQIMQRVPIHKAASISVLPVKEAMSLAEVYQKLLRPASGSAKYCRSSCRYSLPRHSQNRYTCGRRWLSLKRGLSDEFATTCRDSG
jgi:hypothetical protein